MWLDFFLLSCFFFLVIASSVWCILFLFLFVCHKQFQITRSHLCPLSLWHFVCIFFCLFWKIRWFLLFFQFYCSILSKQPQWMDHTKKRRKITTTCKHRWRCTVPKPTSLIMCREIKWQSRLFSVKKKIIFFLIISRDETVNTLLGLW